MKNTDPYPYGWRVGSSFSDPYRLPAQPVPSPDPPRTPALPEQQERDYEADAIAYVRAAYVAEPQELMIACPKCGELHEDLDGFGVLYCEKCGYCTHASVDGDVCGLCHAQVIE